MSYNIHKGNCFEVLADIEDNSVDVVVTSPPYNLVGLRGQKLDRSYKPSADSNWKAAWVSKGIEYDSFEDNLPEDVYHQQQIDLINELLRVIKPEGSIFYQHKIRHWKRQAHHPMKWIMRSDAILHQEIIWNRKNTPALDKRMLFPITEREYWLCKSKPVVFKDRATHKKDIWEISPDMGNKHPAPYPVELAENCIALTCPDNGLVLDPYVGSGTTAIAAINLGHDFVGSDISDNYIEMATQRIEKHLNPDATLEDLL